MPAPANSCSSTISAKPASKGCEVYDFSVGDEPYKRLWCDIETRQFDVVVPLTAKGRLLALQMRLTARLKAFIKNSPLVWKLAKLLRKRAARPDRACRANRPTRRTPDQAADRARHRRMRRLVVGRR